MESTAKLNEFVRAPSSKMVRARFIMTVDVPVVGNGHTRSIPAGIDGTLVSPRFRSGEPSELPVGVSGSLISLEPASEPIPDPTLARGPLGG
jgi:hypothetical protein